MGQEVQRTGEVRLADGRGRHVTTQREMIRMPQGGTVIDSPGIREIQLWLAEEGFEEAFADIRELAAQCKFSNCTHTNEPGCAVLEAMEEDELDPGRWANYLELKEELEALARRRQEIEENFLKKRQSRGKR
jgi:ribosome biogenesis GTPase